PVVAYRRDVNDFHVTAEPIHMGMDDIETASRGAAGPNGEKQNPQPARKAAGRAQGNERQPEVAARVVLPRQNGDIVVLRQLPHQLHPICLGTPKAVSEAVHDKGDVQALCRPRRRACWVHFLRRSSSSLVRHFCRNRRMWVDLATITRGRPKASSPAWAKPGIVVVALV